MSAQISVIVPTFNSAATVGAALRSALTQTIEELEVVVVDDGSTDATPEIVARFAETDSRLRLLRQENAGPGGARNTGIAAATGTFIGFLDSDDLWLPQHAELSCETLRSSTRGGLCHTDCWDLNGDGARIFRLTTLACHTDLPGIEDPGRALETMVAVNYVTASAVTVTREALEAVGTFDPTLTGAEDWDLWLRIAAAGFEVLRAGEAPTVVLRDTPGSASKSEVRMIRGSLTVMNRVAADTRIEQPVREMAANRATGLRRELEVSTAPSPLQRAEAGLLRTAHAVKARALDRRLWRRPPPELQRELERLEGPAADRA